MAQLAERPRFTLAQYLELEAASSTKHEFFEGHIFAMAGGTPDQAARSVAVSGAPQTDPQSATTVLNPTVILKVLSEGPARYDRGDSLDHYRQSPALRACVLVTHDESLIEVHQRSGSTWLHAQRRAGEAARIDAIGCLLEVNEIFA